jgi:hypothetical protein
MKPRSIAVLISLLFFLLPHTVSLADPILKPKKYHGPIPKLSYSLQLGFMAGPGNPEMWGFLDRGIDQPLRKELETNDFGVAFAADGAFTNKVHPQFAVRLKGGVAILKSNSVGLRTSTEVDTSTGLKTLLEFDRDFNVVLLSLEGSALYFFQDASVDEFQTYVGGGFSLYFPYAKYSDRTVNSTTQRAYGSQEKTKFSAEPGIHGVIGALYHVQNDLAVHLELRGLIAQSKFDVNLPTESAGIQKINFDVDYTGFVLTAGVAKFF